MVHVYVIPFYYTNFTVVLNMVHTTSDNQILRTFQGFFKDKLQFLRIEIYSINWHSLTLFWTPHWLKHFTRSFTILTSSAMMVDHIIIAKLLSATTLCKMTGYDLQLHLRYRNRIWNKDTEIKYCSSTKMFLHYPWVL